MKKIYTILITVLLSTLSVKANVADSVQIISLYDRCLDFAEHQADSVLYYAEWIRAKARQSQFSKGELFYSRLMGLHYELLGKYDSAIHRYLQHLSLSKELKGDNSSIYISTAYTDLAILYGTIKDYQKAKELFLEALEYNKLSNSLSGYINNLSNIGTVYSRLNQLDSAQYYLQTALQAGLPYEDQLDLTSLRNNLGTVYYKNKAYDKAIEQFNYGLHLPETDINLPMLWITHLNMADVYMQLKQFDSTEYYLAKAEEYANTQQSISKLSDVFALKAQLEELRGNYKKAYEYQKKWYEYDTANLRLETYNTVLELQERYNLSEQITENKLLQEKINVEKIKNIIFIIATIALIVVVIVVAIALFIKRRANNILTANNLLMAQQNQQLALLNRKKNNLIGMVSHDLKTPFLTINLWSHALKKYLDPKNENQENALNKIIQSCEYGDRLIQRILTIEKNTYQTDISLENIPLAPFFQEITETFQIKAREKNIQLHIDTPAGLSIISDRQLLMRIIENLLSNAIKFSFFGGHIYLNAHPTEEGVQISVQDEGVGIPENELAFLFEKYAPISTEGTHGEKGNGLGLSIVKRLVEELGGNISCKSVINKGSTFIMVFKS